MESKEALLKNANVKSIFPLDDAPEISQTDGGTGYC